MRTLVVTGSEKFFSLRFKMEEGEQGNSCHTSDVNRVLEFLVVLAIPFLVSELINLNEPCQVEFDGLNPNDPLRDCIEGIVNLHNKGHNND